MLKNGVKRRNKQPTTDLCDRMVILLTSFGHNNDLFQDIMLFVSLPVGQIMCISDDNQGIADQQVKELTEKKLGVP